MNKDLIRNRFAKNLNNYNEHAKVQKRMAERLSTFSGKKEYNSILELGCGTGFLTEIINNKIEWQSYTAIDIVADCENFIKQINPKINFIRADLENLELAKYDLIISNAALQWSENFTETVNKFKKALKPDGEFIFSTFGKENFREIFYLIGTKLDYYSSAELQKIFPSAKIEEEIHIMEFKTPREVLNHLKLTGVNAIESKSWTKKDLLEFEKGYKSLCPLRPTITYNPIYIHIS